MRTSVTVPILRTTRSALCGCLLASVATAGVAQEIGPPSDAPIRSEREINLGLGVGYLPKYLGADEHKVMALPVITARWRDGWFAGVGGVGYRFKDDSPFSWGLLLGFNPGRDENDSNALKGTGDIKARAEVGPFFTYRFAPGLSLSGSARYGSGTDKDGLLMDLGVRLMVPLGGGHRLLGGLTTTYANKSYTQNFFGVTPTQALASRYKTYTPGSGVRDVAANIGYGYSFTPDIMMMTGVTYRALQGDAKDSPLTKSSASTSANVMVMYRF